MTVLVAHALASLPDPVGTIDRLAAHLAEEGVSVSRNGPATILASGAHRGTLFPVEGGISLRAEAPDAKALHLVKEMIGAHLIEYAQGAVSSIAWTGDASVAGLPTSHRTLTVVGHVDVTPHMRRITFAGEDLGHFDNRESLHVRLFLPPHGEPGGLRDGTEPVVRKYTIREIDAAAGRVAIDFVLHEDAGPGAAFAARAQPGDRIGVAGPGGRGLREADWYLFLADETALPAVGRMLALLPQTARGLAFIEVADAGERQELAHPPGLTISWLHRDGAEPGTTSLLPDAFERVALPDDETKVFLWAAMEHEAFKEVRAAARARLRADHDAHLVVSYWRRGASEDEHARQKKADRPG